MRVLFSTTAGAGHFGPMVPIAQACVAAGHTVAVAAPLSFADHVARAGLTHLPFPDVPREQMGAIFGRVRSLPREEAERVVVADVFGRLDAQSALPTLLGLVDEWRPDVVVRDPFEFGALVAARSAGIPQAQVAIGFGAFFEQVTPWLDEPLRELDALAGLDAGRDAVVGSELVTATPTFSMLPDSLDPAPSASPPIWRYRPAADNAAGPALPGEWGDPAAPLVYVSFGSVLGAMGGFATAYGRLVETVADLPIRVLLTTGTGFDPDQLGSLPANTRAVQWWPQDAAMREAALVIGHGGFGTTLSALRAGVPQLVIPMFSGDQFFNAERIEASGAGRQLLGGADAFPQIPRMLGGMLGDPELGRASNRYAADLAALPDISTTIDVLSELTQN